MALRWVELGRDVLVRGDDGSERAGLLDRVGADAERLGYRAIRWDPGDAAVDSLAAGVRVGARGARSEREAVFGSEAERTILLVDDLDELNSAALEHLSRMLRPSGTVMVATTTVDLVRWRDARLDRLIAQRGPAELETPPLSYSQMVELAAARLGGPADGPLVSSLLAWSTGNPSVASAMLDAARFCGAVARHQGTWALQADLSTVPLDSVAHLLCARLSAPEVSALDTLSVMGPATPAEVAVMIDQTVLERLMNRRRVVVHGDPPNRRLSVSPPALAAALSARAGRAARDLAGSDGHGHATEDDDEILALNLLLSPDPEKHHRFLRRASGLIGLVLERQRNQEAEARAKWERSHSVAEATGYLNILLRRPTFHSAAEVFEATVVPDAVDVDVRAFRWLQARWIGWHGDESGEWPSFVAQNPQQCEAISQLASVTATVLGTSATPQGESELATTSPLSAQFSEPGRSLGYLQEAATLMEAGHLDSALRLADSANRPEWLATELGASLDGIYDMVLFYLGRVQESAASCRAHLARALAELDPVGIRIHATSLAQNLIALGQEAAASRLLFVVLRLGPAGPVASSFYQHTLILAVTYASFSETPEATRLLADELRRIPDSHVSTVNPLLKLAEAHLLRADGDEAGADSLLWAEGERLARNGQLLSALRLWVQRTSIPDEAALATIQEITASRQIPVLSQLVQVIAALATGSVDDVLGAARKAPLTLAPPLAAAVLGFMDARRVSAGLPPLTSAERMEIAGSELALRLASRDSTRQAASLSAREREIVRLAAQGYRNREIAAMLVISTRTVENHIYRALTKLGLTSREDFHMLSL